MLVMIRKLILGQLLEGELQIEEVILLIKKDKYFKQLKTHMHILNKKDIYQNKNINNCPNCSGTYYIKYGLYKGI